MRGQTWTVASLARTGASLARTGASLALVALMATSCGDSGSTTPAVPAAPPAAKKTAAPAEVVPAAPKVAPIAPAAVPAAPGEVVKELPPVPTTTTPSAAVAAVEDVAKELGIELTDGNREVLEKVAEAVQDGDAQDAIKDAAKSLGVDADALEGAGLGGLGDKLGFEGDDRDAAAAKKKAGDQGDSVAKKATDPALSGLNAQKLRKRRKAEVTALETERETALTELRTKFAQKIADKPKKADVLAERQATKEAEITADFAKQITAVKRRYQAAIDAVKQ